MSSRYFTLEYQRKAEKVWEKMLDLVRRVEGNPTYPDDFSHILAPVEDASVGGHAAGEALKADPKPDSTPVEQRQEGIATFSPLHYRRYAKNTPISGVPGQVIKEIVYIPTLYPNLEGILKAEEEAGRKFSKGFELNVVGVSPNARAIQPFIMLDSPVWLHRIMYAVTLLLARPRSFLVCEEVKKSPLSSHPAFLHILQQDLLAWRVPRTVNGYDLHGVWMPGFAPTQVEDPPLR